MKSWQDVIHALVAHRWYAGDGPFPASERAALRAHAEKLRSSGEFRPAGVGRGGAHQVRQDVRGDEVCWWPEDGAALDPAQRAARTRLEKGLELLNRELYLGVRRLEIHYTYYPPGTAYARHVDRFKGTGSRMVSAILYLNDEWAPGDAGELVLYPSGGNGPVVVEPRGGCLACFVSEDFPHEVRPNRAGRWAVTLWFSKE